MNTKKILRDVKFPENREIGKQLKVGDRITIAEYSGKTPGTIRDMMNGYRRITDKVGLAIIRLFEEREMIKKSLKEIANQ